jgi:hypothetical protein
VKRKAGRERLRHGIVCHPCYPSYPNLSSLFPRQSTSILVCPALAALLSSALMRTSLAGLRVSDSASSASSLPAYRPFLRRQGFGVRPTPAPCLPSLESPAQLTTPTRTTRIQRAEYGLPPPMTPRVIIRIWVSTCHHLWAHDLHRVRQVTPSTH